jgi:hypothetical protein
MPDKNEIERRKKIKQELREKARFEFEKSLPISQDYFRNLFDYLDGFLSENECDNTLKVTVEYLEKNNINNIEEVILWLNENGGYCDCEVLFNIEEMFDENAIL